MDWTTLLSPAATIIVGVGVYYSPGARERRRQRHAADTRMLGRAAVKDRSGDILEPAVPSLAAQVDDIQEIVKAAALLNGHGEKLVTDVAWLRKQLAAHVKDAEAHAG